MLHRWRLVAQEKSEGAEKAEDETPAPKAVKKEADSTAAEANATTEDVPVSEVSGTPVHSTPVHTGGCPGSHTGLCTLLLMAPTIPTVPSTHVAKCSVRRACSQHPFCATTHTHTFR